MTTKRDLLLRIAGLERWRDNVARVGADGAQGGSFELVAIAERVAVLERAQAAPAPRYASSETYLEAIAEQVAALERAQAEPTNRQCVAEEFLSAAEGGNTSWLRHLANEQKSIHYPNYIRLSAMAAVLERAARERGE
jgi:hypothetical protein